MNGRYGLSSLFSVGEIISEMHLIYPRRARFSSRGAVLIASSNDEQREEEERDISPGREKLE